MEHLGLALILFATFWIGTFAGYMAMKMRSQGQYEKGKAEATSETAQFRERLVLRDQQLSEVQKKAEALEQEHLRLQAEVKVISDQKSQFEVRANLLPKYEQEVEARGQRIMQLATDLARMQGALNDSMSKVEELKATAAPTNAAEFQATIQQQLQQALSSIQMPAANITAPNVDWKAVLAPLAHTLQTVEVRVQQLAEQAAAVQIPTQLPQQAPAEGAASNAAAEIQALTNMLSPLQETLSQVNTKIEHLEAGQQAAQLEVRQSLAVAQNLAHTVANTTAQLVPAQEQAAAPAVDWEQLLSPLQETLRKVEARMESLEKQPSATADISEQVNALQAAAKSLVDGLRKPNPRSRWSDMQLRRLVELAGMVPYADFTDKQANQAENAPELLVRLPQGRVIAVDAKVPVSGYFEAMEAGSPAEQQTMLEAHAGRVRGHLEFLASQSYWKCFSQAPEFVVAYLPGETFYGAILEQDPQLLEFCVERKVLLATPTTLIALLKTIGQGWEQNLRNDDSVEIRKLAHSVAEKLNDLANNLNEVHRNLELTNSAFSRTLGAWEGNLMPVFAQLQTISVAPISDEARTNQSIQFLAKATMEHSVEITEAYPQPEAPKADTAPKAETVAEPELAPALVAVTATEQEATIEASADAVSSAPLTIATTLESQLSDVSSEVLSPSAMASSFGALSVAMESYAVAQPAVEAPTRHPLESSIHFAPPFQPAIIQAPIVEAPIAEAPIVETPVFDAPVFDAPAVTLDFAAPVEAPLAALQQAAALQHPVTAELPAEAPVPPAATVQAPAAEPPVLSLADLLVASPFESLRRSEK